MATDAYWQRMIERRLEQIEAVKPEVLAERVNTLAGEVKALRRAFTTFAFSIVGASVVFAFSVFALLGKP